MPEAVQDGARSTPPRTATTNSGRSGGTANSTMPTIPTAKMSSSPALGGDPVDSNSRMRLHAFLLSCTAPGGAKVQASSSPEAIPFLIGVIEWAHGLMRDKQGGYVSGYVLGSMNSALVSLAALLLAIVLSFSSRLNVGIPALGLAWLLGALTPGSKSEALATAFPASLFLTLLGVTLLFAAAESNGTLARLAERAVALVGGDRRLVPWMLFLLAGAVSAVGPGAVSSVALVAPLAAPIGARLGLPAFLVALCVANGANAGNLSPLSVVGIIANSRMAEAGLAGHEAKVFAANFLAHVIVTVVVYVFWLRRSEAVGSPDPRWPGAGASPSSGSTLPPWPCSRPGPWG